LIYILAVVYLLIIGPGFRKYRNLDYRLVLGGLVVVVLAFTGIFGYVGRRGYGESQVFHGAGIWRSLGGGRYDTTQWISAFATEGALYQLTFGGEATVLTAPPTGVTGLPSTSCLAGNPGRVAVEIPLFSSAAVTVQSIQKLDKPWRIVPAPREGDSALEAFDISHPTLKATACWRLSAKGTITTLKQGDPRDRWFRDLPLRLNSNNHFYGRRGRGGDEERQLSDTMKGLLIDIARGEKGARLYDRTRLWRGQEVFFILAQAPEENRPQIAKFRPGKMDVLFCELWEPSTQQTTAAAH
jgi:hypothetical protein